MGWGLWFLPYSSVMRPSAATWGPSYKHLGSSSIEGLRYDYFYFLRSELADEVLSLPLSDGPESPTIRRSRFSFLYRGFVTHDSQNQHALHS
jgi:hypothetical protein